MCRFTLNLFENNISDMHRKHLGPCATSLLMCQYKSCTTYIMDVYNNKPATTEGNDFF